MKHLLSAAISALIICSATAQQPGSNAIRPQPRPRLDPEQTATATPVTTPIADDKNESGAPLMLQRLVVKERGAIPLRRPAVDDPVGEFSPLRGGRYLRRDIGKFRVEAGLWPSIELFEEEARFKPMKVPIHMDFLRIKW